MQQYHPESHASHQTKASVQKNCRDSFAHQRMREDLLFLAVLILLFALIFTLCRGIYHVLHSEDETVRLASAIEPSLQDSRDEAGRSEIQELTSDQKRDYILSHSDIYPQILQELVQKNEETIDFVYQYPSAVSSDAISLSTEELSDGIPLLLQWDSRWGYCTYGTGLIGYTGCGPTCLSMVVAGLTGNTDATPAAIAAYAEQDGYYSSGTGTTWALMSEGCQHYGLLAEELALSEKSMVSALSSGQPIIASVGHGDFTDTGHFIVITAYSDGAFTVHDPNSRRRSQQRWSFETLRTQIKNLWAFARS